MSPHGVIEKAKGSAPNNPSKFELKAHFAVPITTESTAVMEQEQKEYVFTCLREHTVTDPSAKVQLFGEANSLYDEYLRCCRMRAVEPVTVGAVSAHVEQSQDHEQHKPFLEPVRGIQIPPSPSSGSSTTWTSMTEP